MDVSSIAAAAVAARQAGIQMAMAAKIAKMNAANQRSVVTLIEAANTNLQQLSRAALPPGVGGTVDISV